MASETYPLALPDELNSEIQAVATEFGLSMAEAMRLALKLGVPLVREQLRPHTQDRRKNKVEWSGSKTSLNEHLQRLSDLGLRIGEHPSAQEPVPACRF